MQWIRKWVPIKVINKTLESKKWCGARQPPPGTQTHSPPPLEVGSTASSTNFFSLSFLLQKLKILLLITYIYIIYMYKQKVKLTKDKDAPNPEPN